VYRGKRSLDVCLALGLIIISGPLVLLTAALTLLISWRHPFFRQCRPGFREKCFTLYKLRTFFSSSHPFYSLLRPWGRLLRSSSIDELPQLINVLRGDMSMVGPRPLLEEYLPLYNEEQRRRHSVKPGISGWAQVHGRNRLPWHKRFELDLWYVENQSLKVDLMIIFKTLQKIIRPSDVKPEGLREDEKFKGN
jgi:sugar transferase EpsL